jgi:hypothetical protein
MSHTTTQVSACPHCGGALKAPEAGSRANGAKPEIMRYDLENLLAESATDKAYDESAQVRVTQQDIRNLLAKRRKGK